MSFKDINQIEVFLNEAVPENDRVSSLEKPVKVSKKSFALFKTSKRRKHDDLLSTIIAMSDHVLAELKTGKDIQEKLQSSMSFSHHELTALKEKLMAILAERDVTDAKMTTWKNEFVAENTLFAEPLKEVSNGPCPYQAMVNFGPGRFGLWKRYKKGKHTRIIAICTFAVTDIIKVLREIMDSNDETICAINRLRDSLTRLQRAEEIMFAK